jgi:hypothetical protein
VPFGSSGGEPPLAGDAAARIQYARRDRWDALPSQHARDARLLLHLLHIMREHLHLVRGRADQVESLFVSHAKADGDETARAM